MRKDNQRIYVSVTNDLCTDQRVAKVCNTLEKNGYTVTLIGRKLSDSWPLSRAYSIKRFRLPFNSGPLFYVSYSICLFFFLLFSKRGFLLSNDLDTLLPNFIVSRLKRMPLIYDSHEYFTEVPELVDRPFVKMVWSAIEKYVVPKVHAAYTVSKPIADVYRLNYGVNFEVIRNLPYRSSTVPDENRKRIVIYQGALNIGRGLEIIIDAMVYFDGFLWIAGDGDLTDKLKSRVKEKKLENKVVFLGRLSAEQLKKITPQASIGLSLEEQLGLNYTYALPNKLFDYIQSKLPVLVSPLPEMSKVVNEYQVGEVLHERDPEALAAQMSSMLNDSKKYQTWKTNCQVAALELNWEKESVKLEQLMDGIKAKFC